MVDTGCELNLIKESMVDSRVWVNHEKIYYLVGIGPKIIKSLGEIRVIIGGVESAFQIVPKDFPIEQNGILGISFLGKHGATLQFSRITLKLGLENPSNDNHSKIKLPARSKTLIEIPLKETHLTQGYIGKINFSEGQKERAARFSALLKVIDLKGLNEEEKQSMLSTLGDYFY